MGAVLGWGAARIDAEVARFAEEARAEGIGLTPSADDPATVTA
jgi:hypothetical protein